MLKIDDLIIDKEFEELLPVLTPEEFVRLEQSVLKNGMLDPIKVWEEPNTGRYIIIDGHNRYNILKKNNLGFKYCAYFLMALPSGWIIRKWGYRRGVITGLVLFGTSLIDLFASSIL